MKTNPTKLPAAEIAGAVVLIALASLCAVALLSLVGLFR